MHPTRIRLTSTQARRVATLAFCVATVIATPIFIPAQAAFSASTRTALTAGAGTAQSPTLVSTTANTQLKDVVLPDAPGRDEVEAYCSGCHSLHIVVQQKGLTRDRWDELLEWMVEEQAMEPIEPPDRKLVLDYLSDKLGPKK